MKDIFYIAGPCAAESREQILEIAEFLANNTSVNMLRAGVWKARTMPSCFEGIGVEALSWLQEARSLYGLQISTEIIDVSHVEKCLEANIDMLWLGARTVVNPMAVQKIADALRGIKIKVGVKNPVSSDVKLWLGAIERIENADVSDVFAIHRGFASPHSVYRNAPMWENVVALKALRPDLTIISDPSHIAGDRNLVAEIAQQALNMDVNGLMIEVHNNPAKALSDAKQQLSLPEFAEIFLKLHKKTASANQEIENLRLIIDNLDEELLNILAKRFDLVKKIGDIKSKNDMTILQIERWKQVLQKNIDLAPKYGLSTYFVEDMLNLIHQEAIKTQNV